MKVINRDPEFFYPHAKKNNELSLYHYGKHVCPAGNAWGPDVRDYYLFHFIVSGKGVYQCGGKEWKLGAGDIFLIRPSEETRYAADEKNPWEYFFVAFHGSRAKEIVDAIPWKDGYIFHPAEFESVKKRVRELYAVKTPDDGGGYRVLGLFYLIISELISGCEEKSDAGDEKRAVLNAALDFIKENYASPIRVTDIAEHVCMHRSNLYKLFKEVLGISVMDYLLTYRLNLATSMLLSTELTVSEIAGKVGYTDTPHFCKAFKERYRFTPASYRKCYKK